MMLKINGAVMMTQFMQRGALEDQRPFGDVEAWPGGSENDGAGR